MFPHQRDIIVFGADPLSVSVGLTLCVQDIS